MRTPTLFDVPKDTPSREQRIAAVKKELGIFTFHSKHMDRSEESWTAILKESVDETDEAMWDRVGRYCMRMEEEGTMTYGRTEREAIERLPKDISRNRGATKNKMSTPQSSPSPSLPGQVTAGGIANPTPKLPFDPSVKQPTPEERAVIEAKWKAQTEVPRSLAQLIILVNAHPEWLTWAKNAESGTMTFNG